MFEPTDGLFNLVEAQPLKSKKLWKKDKARSIRDDDDFYLSLECLEVEDNFGIVDFEFIFLAKRDLY